MKWNRVWIKRKLIYTSEAASKMKIGNCYLALLACFDEKVELFSEKDQLVWIEIELEVPGGRVGR